MSLKLSNIHKENCTLLYPPATGATSKMQKNYYDFVENKQKKGYTLESKHLLNRVTRLRLTYTYLWLCYIYTEGTELELN